MARLVVLGVPELMAVAAEEEAQQPVVVVLAQRVMLLSGNTLNALPPST